MRIPFDSWNIIEKVIRRYPANNRKKAELLDEAITRTPKGDRKSLSPDAELQVYTSPTEKAAVKLTGEYAQRIDREINAVRNAYDRLRPEEKAVIAARYWHDSKKNTAYYKINVAYSEKQMKRICKKMVIMVGKSIGEFF